ncbi:MAG: hypothetical protein OCU16_05455 [Candidatus Methanospirare jalkutatii]|nr:hypothetical protein [Candidatus Methanospirare jalkutatii]
MRSDARCEVLLWACAFATYGVGDTLTTYINLAYGASELNPLINYYTIIPLKIFIFFIFLTLYLLSRNIIAPLMLTIVGFAGTLWNLLTFLSIS